MKELDSKLVAQSHNIKLFDKTFESNGKIVKRTVVSKPDAAAVVYLRGDNKVAMVSQVREAVLDANSLEIPAGHIDGGENPIQAAIRELREEVGVTVENATFIKMIYPSCGFLNEAIYLYYATDGVYGNQDLDNGEHVTVRYLDINDAIDKTNDAKSLVALYAVKEQLGL